MNGTDQKTDVIAEAVRHVSDVEKIIANTESLVSRLNDARKAMEMTMSMFKPDWQAWMNDGGKMLHEIRTWRMAIDAEAGRALSQMGDVRKFFLSNDHPVEIERLRDFVGLCERLKALKDCGFLDDVADVILKLEEVSGAKS